MLSLCCLFCALHPSLHFSAPSWGRLMRLRHCRKRPSAGGCWRGHALQRCISETARGAHRPMPAARSWSKEQSNCQSRVCALSNFIYPGNFPTRRPARASLMHQVRLPNCFCEACMLVEQA